MSIKKELSVLSAEFSRYVLSFCQTISYLSWDGEADLLLGINFSTSSLVLTLYVSACTHGTHILQTLYL